MKKFYNLIVYLFIYLAVGCGHRYIGPVAEKNGVTFKIRAPAAKIINIVGSFNHWNIEDDKLCCPDKDGVWSITLPLEEGRHEYLFLINGKKWLLDPSAHASSDDGLGGKNSVFYLKK